MKKILFAICLTAFAGVSAFAQDDYKKGEFFIGYSNQQVDTGVDPTDFDSFVNDRETFHGFNASGVYNVGRYVGVKGDISGAYKSQDFNFTVPTGPGTSGNVSFDADAALYNFVAGLQFKNNTSDARVKPFAHIMGGLGHARLKVSNLNCTGGVDCSGVAGSESVNGLAGVFGGGVDIRLNNRVDLRLIQVDYNPIRLDGDVSHNMRFGIGFVFK